MNFNRILNLIRYDWSLYKRNCLMALGIALGTFLVCGAVPFLWHILSNHNAEGNLFGLPTTMLLFANTFVRYGNVVMVILVTVGLTQKFVNPSTATAYLTLPGTSLEKLIVLCLDYLAGTLSLHVVMYIGVVIFYCIGIFVAPESHWGNIFLANDMTGSIDVVYNNMSVRTTADFESAMAVLNQEIPGMGDLMTNVIHTASCFSITAGIASCLFYMVLNMYYKRLGQLKAIATYVGIIILLGIGLVIYSVSFISSHAELWRPEIAGNISPASMMNGSLMLVSNIMGCIIWFLRLSPVLCVGLLAILYCQIKKKQAF